jgi:hypothetical protein
MESVSSGGEECGPLHGGLKKEGVGYFSASAPDTISISSLVITAWRVRL